MIATLRNYLKEEGIMHTLAAIRPFLSEEYAAIHYAWALKHCDKDCNFWRTVLFTNESTIKYGAGAH